MASLFLLLQNMLVEIEQKVVALSELSVHNDNLLLEGKAHTKEEAEQLAVKLRTLKGSLLDLQRALHDKQLLIQVRAPAIYSKGTSPSPAACLPPAWGPSGDSWENGPHFCPLLLSTSFSIGFQTGFIRTV